MLCLVYKIKIIELMAKFIERLGIIFLPIYWLSFLSIRNKNICLCGSTFGKSFTGSPKYFYLYMNHIESDVRFIWISRDDDIVKKLNLYGYEAYNVYSLKGMYYSLKAKTYVFDHYSKDISFWLSGGTIKFNLWHGIPLKKGNKDNKFDVVRNPRNLYDKLRWTFRRIQNENPTYYYAVTSEFIRKLHTKAFAAKYERVFVCGYARNDCLFNSEYIKDKAELIIGDYKLYTSLQDKKAIGSKIIVYMPTHRDSEEIFFDVVDLNKLNSFLKENNIILLVKAHIRSRLHKEFNQIEYSNITNLKPTEDPYPFLNISDALITDYSSVYFDYLLIDKPIIFFSYDLDIYMTESRELYYSYDSVTPGIRAKDIKGLKQAIKYALYSEDKYREERKRVLNQMFDYCDGKSSERLYIEMSNLLKWQ